MARRVVIGKQLSGAFGMRVSLPGHDAYTGDSSVANAFSFDSNWPDLAKIHQVGIYTAAVVGSTVPPWVFPDLGYKPFIEIRWLEGATVHDDYYRGAYGAGATIDRTTLKVPLLGGYSDQFLCIAYRIAVPSQ